MSNIFWNDHLCCICQPRISTFECCFNSWRKSAMSCVKTLFLLVMVSWGRQEALKWFSSLCSYVIITHESTVSVINKCSGHVPQDWFPFLLFLYLKRNLWHLLISISWPPQLYNKWLHQQLSPRTLIITQSENKTWLLVITCEYKDQGSLCLGSLVAESHSEHPNQRGR